MTTQTKMPPTVAEPQTAIERVGKALFPFRGIPGIVFFLLLLLGVGPKATYSMPWQITGLLCLGFGEWMRLISRRYIGRSSSTRKVKVSRLVTGGPYRHVRNPIYVGNLFILIGFGFTSGFLWTVAVFFPLMTVYYYLIATFECRMVLHNFPEEGQKFVDTVPAWIPSLTPKPVKASEPVPWAEVFRREGNTLLGIGIALLVLAVRELGWIPNRFF